MFTILRNQQDPRKEEVTSGTHNTAHVHVYQCGSNQPVRSVLQSVCSKCEIQTSVTIIIE